jgi:excisionase family DNA binding protein
MLDPRERSGMSRNAVDHLGPHVPHTDNMTRDSLYRHLPIHDVEDTGEMLGVSSRTVRRLAAKGVLASHRVGESLRFSEADIADYIRRARSDPVT